MFFCLTIPDKASLPLLSSQIDTELLLLVGGGAVLSVDRPALRCFELVVTGHPNIVKILTRASANPNMVDASGCTAMMFACENKSRDAAQNERYTDCVGALPFHFVPLSFPFFDLLKSRGSTSRLSPMLFCRGRWESQLHGSRRRFDLPSFRSPPCWKCEPAEISGISEEKRPYSKPLDLKT